MEEALLSILIIILLVCTIMLAVMVLTSPAEVEEPTYSYGEVWLGPYNVIITPDGELAFMPENGYAIPFDGGPTQIVE